MEFEGKEIVFDPYAPKEKFESKTQYYRNIGYMNRITSKKWRRLIKMNKWLDKDQAIENNMMNHFEYLMSFFDISNHIKQLIKKEVFIRKPQFLKEVVLYVFDSIIQNNFPITTNEYREIIREKFRIGKDTIDQLLTTRRNYTWFINRILSKLNLKNDTYHKLYKIVEKNFNKLQPKLQSDPTSLISILCRLSYMALKIREDLPGLDIFEISTSTYTRYREIFKELGIILPKHVRRRKNEN